MTAKNEVVKAEETAVAVTSPTLQVEIEKEDMMVPFVKVIQQLSEECTAGKDKYNPEVKAGDIYDSVTRTIFRDAKAVICGLKKYYAEWTPEVRGKLVGKHKPTSDVVVNAVRVEKTSDKGNTYFSLQTKSGNDLVETYGVVMIIKNSDGLVLPAVLTLSKTGFIVGKQLTTILALHQTKGVPVFKLTTSSASNTKGSWYKPAFVFDSYESDPSVIDMASGMAALTDKILFNNLNSDDGVVTLSEEDNIL